MPIRILPIEDTNQACQLLAIQRAAYQIEAELIGSDAIPPLTETLVALQQCSETFYGYWHDSTLAGAISYKQDRQTLDIHRLIVHPAYFRRGIGRALLRFIEELNSRVERIIVSTGRDNTPARQLYISVGFRNLNDEEVVPGLYITHFEKLLTTNESNKQIL